MSEMGEAVTSETLGPMMKMNPVVLRRTLAGLRDAGIVHSVKGHGGGWSLARTLEAVTLGEVYEALGPTMLFGIGHRDPRAACPIEQAVNRTVGGALGEAEALLMARLRSITVADIVAGARRKAPHRSRKANAHA
jgi:DNA-binding IscR family transcriptional regulator